MFRWSLIVFGFFWSILVIPAESVRYAHFDVTEAIANGRRVKPADLDAAVDAYKLIGSAGICMPGIREQLANLLFRRGTTYRQLNEVDEAVADLEQADTTVRSLLACSPFESNQWLSLAIIDAKRRGGGDKTFAILNMSYLTGPREGWIIHRRMEFIATIVPFLPDSIRRHHKNDQRVLRRVTN